jgi:hypothetical protein
MLASRCIAVLSLVIVGLGLAASPSTADEKLKDIACRSVHLGYPAGEGIAFYNEVTVDESAPGTYFMVCGWNKGYFGIQEQGNGKKVLIFSVWDSGQNNPKAVDEDKRVKLLHKDEKVRIGRFGGEGTGGQSFLDYDWKAGQTYRFLVTARPNDTRTEYAGYFYMPEDKAWKHLVTFSTITGGKNLGGYYSFVEDFKRDKVSTTRVRKAHFGNAWIQGKDGDWAALRKARFTADSNPVTNIDAGVEGDRFFLATGGETKNAGTRLGEMMDLPAGQKPTPPTGLPSKRAAESR